MASVIDELMCREGEILPEYLGINQAKAGDMLWDREPDENEADFLTRARRDAALLGYKVICIAGHLNVGTAHQFTASDCRRLGLDWES